MATITHFMDLHAWKQCREIRIAVRQMVRGWPTDEKYRLVDQIIRSSRSSTANISEGYGRFYERDNIRFCRMAKGSLYETQDHLVTARDEGYITEDQFKELFDRITRAITVLNGYVRYLNGLKASGSALSEPAAAYGSGNDQVVEPPSLSNPLDADL